MSETDEEKKEREEKEAAEKKAVDDAAEEKAAQSKKESEETAAAKSPLEEARALDKSIKEGTAKMANLLKKNEKIMADAAISGKGFAGQGAIQKETDDEKWAKEAKERYAGTGMDPTEDDSGPVKYSR